MSMRQNLSISNLVKIGSFLQMLKLQLTGPFIPYWTVNAMYAPLQEIAAHF